MSFTLVYSDTENGNTGYSSEFAGFRGRYSWRPRKDLRVHFSARRDAIENDEAWIDLLVLNQLVGLGASTEDYPGGINVSYQEWVDNVLSAARPVSAEGFNAYSRPSALDRTDDHLGADVLWRPIPRGLLRVGYEYRQIDRDNVVLAEGDGKTTSHTLKTAWNQRFGHRVRWNSSLRYTDTDNPYLNLEGALRQYDPNETGFSPSPPGPKGTDSLQYFELHQLRVANLGNAPTEGLRLRSHVSWSPKTTWALSGTIRARTAENDESNEDLATRLFPSLLAGLDPGVLQALQDDLTWERDSLGVNVSLWVAPEPGFYVTLAYDHQIEKTKSPIVVPLMDG